MRTLTKSRTYPDPVQKAHECTLHCHRVAGHVAACTVKDPGVARHVWASAAGARYQEAKLSRQLLVYAHGSCWHMLGRARDARIAGLLPSNCIAGLVTKLAKPNTRRTIQRHSSLDRPDTRDTRRSIELERTVASSRLCRPSVRSVVPWSGVGIPTERSERVGSGTASARAPARDPPAPAHTGGSIRSIT